MRVAIFKNFPAASAFWAHPFRRAVESSPVVTEVEYYIRTPLAAQRLPSIVDRRAARLVLRGPVHEYSKMNDPQLIADLREKRFDIIVPDGQGLVSGAFIDTARIGVLLFHYGPLPEMRGMDTVEWCMLLGRTPATTLFFYDPGIDTGEIIFRADVPGRFPTCHAAKRAAWRVSLDLMNRFWRDPERAMAGRRSQRVVDGVTYYVLHPALIALTDMRLSGRVSPAHVDREFSRLMGQLPAPRPAPGCTSTLGLSDVLVALRTPAQEREAPDEDRVVTALHFLHKRKGVAPEVHAGVRAGVDSLLAGPTPSFVTQLRVVNDMLFLLDRAPEFAHVLSSAAAAELVRDVLRRLTTDPE